MKTPLRRAREKQGWTLQDLVLRVGSDVGNLSRIERGVQMPSKELLQKICAQFPGDLDELMVLFPERYPEEPGNEPAPGPAEQSSVDQVSASVVSG